MSPAALTVLSPVKANLFLAIGGRRPDGYHDLTTVYVALDVGERVTLRPAARASVTCDLAGVPLDETNLALAALRAMEREVGRPIPLALHLTKRIPPGTGLGAGSGNAAAVLLGVNALLTLQGSDPVPLDTLRALAASLGSDVPFVLEGGAAVGRGRGELLEPLSAPTFAAFVVVVPSQRMATREAYEAWDLQEKKLLTPVEPGLSVLLDGWKRRDLSALVPGIRNDFEEVVPARVATVAEAKEALGTADALAAWMTGSGTAVLGLFPTAEEAEGAVRRLGSGGWAVVRGTVLERRDQGSNPGVGDGWFLKPEALEQP